MGLGGGCHLSVAVDEVGLNARPGLGGGVCHSNLKGGFAGVNHHAAKGLPASPGVNFFLDASGLRSGFNDGLVGFLNLGPRPSLFQGFGKGDGGFLRSSLLEQSPGFVEQLAQIVLHGVFSFQVGGLFAFVENIIIY